jgi:dipeptidyl aminopeptidase/acylaminoacyl peptidase
MSLDGCRLTGSSTRIIAERECVHYDRWFVTVEGEAGWSPDGYRVVALTRTNPLGADDLGLYVVELPSGRWKKVLSVTPGLFLPERCHWHPTLNRVFVDYGIAGGGILDLSSGEFHALTEPDGIPISSGKWSPEGDSVWYWRNGDTYVISANGGAPRPVTLPLFRPVGEWSFSPDGTRMAFAIDSRDPGGGGWYRQEIAILNRDGTGYRVLTRLNGNSANPQWIHGGREILFDTIPVECFGQFTNMERYWCAVDVKTGAVRWLGSHLGSSKFQFSFPNAVDRRGEHALVVGELKREGGRSPIGVLYVTPIERADLQRLFRPGAPEAP